MHFLAFLIFSGIGIVLMVILSISGLLRYFKS